MNPILKRFLKGLVATAIAGLVTKELSFSIAFLVANPVALGSLTAIVAGLLLALEKSIPNNL